MRGRRLNQYAITASYLKTQMSNTYNLKYNLNNVTHRINVANDQCSCMQARSATTSFDHWYTHGFLLRTLIPHENQSLKICLLIIT